MIIKAADDKTTDIQTLQGILSRQDLSGDTRKRVEQELRNIFSGIKGEAEAAYELNFTFGNGRNWAVIHDLRLECEGRVAQIDHVLINRFLDIFVFESKRFAEGIAINDHGEFAAFYNGRAYGVPSPIEQNKKHIEVLSSVFRTGQVKLPRRLGFAIQPTLYGFVLVSKNARITRPRKKVPELDLILKNDQLASRLDSDDDKKGNAAALQLAKLIGQDTLQEFAREVSAAHKPAKFDWLAKFGLREGTPTDNAPEGAKAIEEKAPVQGLSALSEIPPADETEPKKAGFYCANCEAGVAYAVAKFCWTQKARFGGKVYCRDCQGAYSR